MALNNNQIEALVKMGFSRWTNGNMDRLYINSTRCGLECSYYKTGNIHYAELNGEQISNCRARAVKASKNYIDIADGSIHSEFDELRVNVQKMLDKVLAA